MELFLAENLNASIALMTAHLAIKDISMNAQNVAKLYMAEKHESESFVEDNVMRIIDMRSSYENGKVALSLG